MILVDTSVWVDHLGGTDPVLVEHLRHEDVSVHPAVMGELALGSLDGRGAVLEAMERMPHPIAATDTEVLGLIARFSLRGSGIGWVDAHLAAAALLTPGALLWTRDRRLRAVAERLGVSADLD